MNSWVRAQNSNQQKILLFSGGTISGIAPSYSERASQSILRNRPILEWWLRDELEWEIQGLFGGLCHFVFLNDPRFTYFMTRLQHNTSLFDIHLPRCESTSSVKAPASSSVLRWQVWVWLGLVHPRRRTEATMSMAVELPGLG